MALLEKARSNLYPAETIMNVDFTNDIVFLANLPTKAESLLHSLEQAEGGIGFHVNADKMKYMWFNRKETSPH